MLFTRGYQCVEKNHHCQIRRGFAVGVASLISLRLQEPFTPPKDETLWHGDLAKATPSKLFMMLVDYSKAWTLTFDFFFFLTCKKHVFYMLNQEVSYQILVSLSCLNVHNFCAFLNGSFIMDLVGKALNLVKPRVPRQPAPHVDFVQDAKGEPAPDTTDGVMYVITEVAQYSLKDRWN